MNAGRPPLQPGAFTANPFIQALFAAGLVYLAWKLAQILLLAFAGLLIAVGLRHCARALSTRFKLGTGISLALTIGGIVAVLAALILWIGPQTVTQLGALGTRLPQSLEQVEASLRQSQAGRFLIDRVTEGSSRPRTNLLGTIGGALSTTANVILNLVIVLTVAVFLAINPGLYRRGLLHLVPQPRRARTEQILDILDLGLWRWLLGNLLSCTLVGFTLVGGLALMGVPLAAALGVIAGLINIIPNFGPVIAAIPAVAIAFSVSPGTALGVAALFIVVNQIEGNILLPLILKKATDVPPALTIIAVVAGGAFVRLAWSSARQSAALRGDRARPQPVCRGHVGRPIDRLRSLNLCCWVARPLSRVRRRNTWRRRTNILARCQRLRLPPSAIGR